MNDVMAEMMKKLSSRSVLCRKSAIRDIKRHLGKERMAELLLQYVAEHDPCYTVRNIARQAFYIRGGPPEGATWEKHYVFRLE